MAVVDAERHQDDLVSALIASVEAYNPGVDKDLIIQRFLTQMPIRFEPAKGPAALRGVVIAVDPETGRATSIQRLNVPA